MERLFCVVLCAAVLLFGTAFPHEEETEIKENDVKQVSGKIKPSTYLYFGPRIGRKRRNPVDESFGNDEMEMTEQLDKLMEAIQDSPWAIVAVNEGKRHTLNFTPRLGRDSGEDFSNSERWLKNPESSREMLSQRSPPFAPRLGKRVYSFSPRLGRENGRNRMS